MLLPHGARSWLRGQVRGYRSKRAAMGLRSKTNLPSLKPLNNRVSWEAVKPFLPEQQGLSMQDAKMKAAYEAAPILDSALPPIPQASAAHPACAQPACR